MEFKPNLLAILMDFCYCFGTEMCGSTLEREIGIKFN